jgi:hypothetical protein
MSGNRPPAIVGSTDNLLSQLPMRYETAMCPKGVMALFHFDLNGSLKRMATFYTTAMIRQFREFPSKEISVGRNTGWRTQA